MSELFESELVDEVETIDVSKAVVVTQRPIIAYDTLEAISKNVSDKIQSLNIESLDPTESNLSLFKRTRADLTKDNNDLENQRKMVKEVIMKPYNDFEDDYKRLISSLFKKADDQLKTLIATIDDKILSVKVDGLKKYFDEINTFDFVQFDHIGLKIIKSKSDKIIKTEIDEYLASIKISLATIETLPNKERVLAKFQMNRDLNKSISETNIEIQREEQIKAQNAERERLEAERREYIEEQRKQAEAQQQAQAEVIEQEALESAQWFIPEPVVEEQPISDDDEVLTIPFTATTTRRKFRMLREFMKREEIKYV